MASDKETSYIKHCTISRAVSASSGQLVLGAHVGGWVVWSRVKPLSAIALTGWVWSSWDALTGKICSNWLRFIRNGLNLELFLSSVSKMTGSNHKWYNKFNLYYLVDHHNSLIYKYLVKFAWSSIFIWLTRWISNSPQPVTKG